MPGHEELAPAASHHHVHARFLALGKQFQPRDTEDVLAAHLRVAAVRHVELIVESPEDGGKRLAGHVAVHAEQLLAQQVFGNAVIMVKPGLRRPTDIEGGHDMRPRPVQDAAQFVPIAHFLERVLFHGCAGDNHPVELLIIHVGKVAVKRLHVFHRRVLRRMALYLHERDFQLQRSIGEQAHQIGLRGNLQRHQVQDDNPQRADVLPRGARSIDDKDVFLLQQVDGGKPVRQIQRHNRFVFYIKKRKGTQICRSKHCPMPQICERHTAKLLRPHGQEFPVARMKTSHHPFGNFRPHGQLLLPATTFVQTPSTSAHTSPPFVQMATTAEISTRANATSRRHERKMEGCCIHFFQPPFHENHGISLSLRPV